jgi:hypothetical protein
MSVPTHTKTSSSKYFCFCNFIDSGDMMHLQQDTFSLHHQGLLIVVDVAPTPSFAVIFAFARGEASEHGTTSPFEEQELLMHEPGRMGLLDSCVDAKKSLTSLKPA